MTAIRMAWIALFLSLAAGTLATVQIFNKGRHVYVVNQKLFNAFKGKQAFEKDLNNLKARHQLLLDSMENAIVQNKEEAGRQKQQVLYRQLLQEFQQEQAQKASEYTERVWVQINQYVKDYGNTHEYEFIFGADGRGTLMYAKDYKDISDQVIEYINKRYEGNP